MQRDVLSEFNHLRDVAMQVADLIAEVRVHMETPSDSGINLELEARFGKISQDARFAPDVGREIFCGILQLLESYPKWSHVTPWQETQDVFYNAEIPKDYGGEADKLYPIRTSVGSNANGEIQIMHNYKQRLRNVDMELCHMDRESCCLNVTRDAVVGGFDVRVSASLERELPHHILPIAVSPDMVRIKQRKRFFLSSLGIQGASFSFDVSLVYAGKTKSEAEQKQSMQASPSYEIEIECLKPSEYLKTSGGEDIMLALSLILKCHDFSVALNSPTSVTYKPVSRRPNPWDMKHLS